MGLPGSSPPTHLTQTFRIRCWNAKHSSATFGLKILENHTFHHLQTHSVIPPVFNTAEYNEYLWVKKNPMKNKNAHHSCTYYRVMIFSNLVCKIPEMFIYYLSIWDRHTHRQPNLHSSVHRNPHRSRMTDQSRIIYPGLHWSRIKSSSTIMTICVRLLSYFRWIHKI